MKCEKCEIFSENFFSTKNKFVRNDLPFLLETLNRAQMKIKLNEPMNACSLIPIISGIRI